MNCVCSVICSLIIIITSAAEDDFILNVPEVFKENNLLLTKSVESSTVKNQFYQAPPASSPSTFYQVPGLINESPPPPPSDTNIISDFSQSTSTTERPDHGTSNSNVVLSRPSAISSDDRLFIVPSSQISLPSSSSSVVSSTVNKVTTQPLTASMALLVSFLLSLIPTLAISLPFFAFRRRRRRIPVTLITGGRGLSTHDDDADVMNMFLRE